MSSSQRAASRRRALGLASVCMCLRAKLSQIGEIALRYGPIARLRRCWRTQTSVPRRRCRIRIIRSFGYSRFARFRPWICGSPTNPVFSRNKAKSRLDWSRVLRWLFRLPSPPNSRLDYNQAFYADFSFRFQCPFAFPLPFFSKYPSRLASLSIWPVRLYWFWRVMGSACYFIEIHRILCGCRIGRRYNWRTTLITRLFPILSVYEGRRISGR